VWPPSARDSGPRRAPAALGRTHFNAELRNNNYGKKVFVKSEYEEKSSLWKLCFRSGKESVEAARAYAKSWLNELK
jgi:hypothetical protein